MPTRTIIRKPPPSLDTGIEAFSVWVFTLTAAAAAAAAAAFTRLFISSLSPHYQCLSVYTTVKRILKLTLKLYKIYFLKSLCLVNKRTS